MRPVIRRRVVVVLHRMAVYGDVTFLRVYSSFDRVRMVDPNNQAKPCTDPYHAAGMH